MYCCQVDNKQVAGWLEDQKDALVSSGDINLVNKNVILQFITLRA